MDMAELNNNDWEWSRASTISNFSLASTTGGGCYWTKWRHTNEPNDITLSHASILFLSLFLPWLNLTFKYQKQDHGHFLRTIGYYTPFRNKRDNLWVWLFYSYFRDIFCQPYTYLSQTFGADGHFEVLNMYKSQLDQKLKAKTQIILFLFFFNFGRKNHENLWLINAHFWPFLVTFWPTN
jgi:hypothetical protein